MQSVGAVRLLCHVCEPSDFVSFFGLHSIKRAVLPVASPGLKHMHYASQWGAIVWVCKKEYRQILAGNTEAVIVVVENVLAKLVGFGITIVIAKTFAQPAQFDTKIALGARVYANRFIAAPIARGAALRGGFTDFFGGDIGAIPRESIKEKRAHFAVCTAEFSVVIVAHALANSLPAARFSIGVWDAERISDTRPPNRTQRKLARLSLLCLSRMEAKSLLCIARQTGPKAQIGWTTVVFEVDKGRTIARNTV